MSCTGPVQNLEENKWPQDKQALFSLKDRHYTSSQALNENNRSAPRRQDQERKKIKFTDRATRQHGLALSLVADQAGSGSLMPSNS